MNELALGVLMIGGAGLLAGIYQTIKDSRRMRKMSGSKIIEGLRQAQAGEFSRVLIDGQTWVRADKGSMPDIQLKLMEQIANKDAIIRSLTDACDALLEYHRCLDGGSDYQPHDAEDLKRDGILLAKKAIAKAEGKHQCQEQ